MVHYNRGRVSAFAAGLHLLALTIAVVIVAGCGGGGGGHPKTVQLSGILTDSYGAVINLPKASVTLDGTSVVAHPNSDGAFVLTPEPGVYTLRGVFLDADIGVHLSGERTVDLSAAQNVNIGVFELGDQSLTNGWEKYRGGDYAGAKQFFQEYLNKAKSGQASLGSVSAYAALGWTRGNGLDKPADAVGNFESAIDGWNGNTDAWVGLAGARLGMMRGDGGFHFNDAVVAATSAISVPGEYSSGPTHDSVGEVDVRAFRAFVNFLNGNGAGATGEAGSIEQAVDSSGNEGSKDVLAIIAAFAG